MPPSSFWSKSPGDMSIVEIPRSGTDSDKASDSGVSNTVIQDGVAQRIRVEEGMMKQENYRKLERRLKWKIDLLVLPLVASVRIRAHIERSNSEANTDGAVRSHSSPAWAGRTFPMLAWPD
jgi:hypothetical protein